MRNGLWNRRPFAKRDFRKKSCLKNKKPHYLWWGCSPTVDTPLPFILPVKMLFNLLIFLIETTLFINVALSFAAAHSGVDFFVNHNIIINTIIFPISLILAMHIRSFLLRD